MILWLGGLPRVKYRYGKTKELGPLRGGVPPRSANVNIFKHDKFVHPNIVFVRIRHFGCADSIG